jgi:hypothetical protein
MRNCQITEIGPLRLWLLIITVRCPVEFFAQLGWTVMSWGARERNGMAYAPAIILRLVVSNLGDYHSISNHRPNKLTRVLAL